MLGLNSLCVVAALNIRKNTRTFHCLCTWRVAFESHPRDGEVEDEVAVVILLQELERRAGSSCVRPDSKLSLPTTPPPAVRFAITLAMNPGASAALSLIVALKRSRVWPGGTVVLKSRRSKLSQCGNFAGSAGLTFS